MTVRASADYILQYSSRIPLETKLLGGTIGIPAEGFATWSINCLPEIFVKDVFIGDKNVVGWWSNDGTGNNNDVRHIGIGRDEQMKLLTDLPLVIRSDKIPLFFQCNKLWDIFRSYRLTYVSITFTVPESVNAGPNHNLYIEWCDGRKWRPAAFEDCCGMVCDTNPTFSSVNSWEIKGWNWLCNPPDVAESCSPMGRASGGQGWHRKQLAYNHPVTIRFRPRHADLQFSHSNFADAYDKSTGVNKVIYQFSQNSKFVRSYLDTDIAQSYTSEVHHWFGPVVRLIDADGGVEAITSGGQNLFNAYGVRCTCSMGLRLKYMKANDNPFPEFVP